MELKTSCRRLLRWTLLALSSEATTIRVMLQYKQYMFVIWTDYNQGYAAVQAIHVCHLRRLQSGLCCSTSNTCLSSEVTTIRVMLQYKQYMFVIWGDYNQGYAAVQAIHVCHLRWLQSGLCCSTSNTCLSSEMTTIRVMLQYKQYMFVIWDNYNQGYAAVQAIHVCLLRWLQSGLCCSTSNTCLSSEMTTIRVPIPLSASNKGLTLETSAKHHIPQATNIPYQPCWSNPYLAYSPTQKKQFFFKTSFRVFIQRTAKTNSPPCRTSRNSSRTYARTL